MGKRGVGRERVNILEEGWSVVDGAMDIYRSRVRRRGVSILGYVVVLSAQNGSCALRIGDKVVIVAKV